MAGEFRPTDSNATRLLFSPTGRSLRKGEGYVGVYEFLLPFVQVGITDRFSMGAGTPLVFFGDESSPPVWLTPKYQFYKDSKNSAAIGVMHFAPVTRRGVPVTADRQLRLDVREVKDKNQR